MEKKTRTSSGNWSEEQKKDYIRTSPDNLFIEAGAGAGKTMLLTRRVVEQIKSGTLPENFLLLTYAPEVAIKLRERILRSLLEERRHLNVSGNKMEAGDKGTGLALTRLEFALFYINQMQVTTMADFAGWILKTYGDKAFSSQKSREEPAGDSTEHVSPSREDHKLSRREARIKNEKLFPKEMKLPEEEMIRRAGELIKNDQSVRRDLKSLFTRIYMDEIQDADVHQMHLLWMLATREGEPEHLRENCLFLVGDVKQSIYWFRGASTALMMDVQKRIKAKKNARILHLVWNFRSSRIMIAWINRTFRRIFPDYRPMESRMEKETIARRKTFRIEGIKQYPSSNAAGLLLEMKKKDPELKWSDFLIIAIDDKNRDACLHFLKRKNIPAEKTAKEYPKGPVRVLTVYQVKGLAGNIVLILDSGSIKAADKLRKIIPRQSLPCLEYVAATRARFALVFLGKGRTRAWFRNPAYGIRNLPPVLEESGQKAKGQC